MLPQLMLLVLTVLTDLATASSLRTLRFVLDIVEVVVDVVAAGAYPSMVEAVVDNKPFSVTDALGKAFRKFWALLAAGIIVVIIVGIGLVALIVPGLFFITWYAYTVPAIMLEDKGALAGMSASRAFGRDKKSGTFSIIIVFLVGAIAVELVELGLSVVSPLLGQLVFAILEVPLAAWFSVTLSYVYIVQGPRSMPAASPSGPGSVSAPPPSTAVQMPMQPSILTATRYCAYCGSPLKPDSKFCPSCGKPV